MALTHCLRGLRIGAELVHRAQPGELSELRSYRAAPATGRRITPRAALEPILGVADPLGRASQVFEDCMQVRGTHFEHPAQVRYQHVPRYYRAQRAERRAIVSRSVNTVSSPAATNRRSWRGEENGPRTCSSTIRPGRSKATTRAVIWNVTPKCRARNVTSSPRPSEDPAPARRCSSPPSHRCARAKAHGRHIKRQIEQPFRRRTDPRRQHQHLGHAIRLARAAISLRAKATPARGLTRRVARRRGSPR